MSESITDKYPQLVNERNYKKNQLLMPESFSCGSNKKVWWICARGHEYEATISSRTGAGNRKPTGCPYCSGSKVLTGFNDIATTNPELMEEWDYVKNTVSPQEISKGSQKKYWWICKDCGSSFQTTIGHRLRLKEDGSFGGCAKCKSIKTAQRMSKRTLIVGETDLKTMFPDVAAEWDYVKNNDRPEDYTPFVLTKKWWKCKQGHSFDMVIANRTAQGQDCPYCSGQRVLAGFNDLESQFPEVAAEWDYEHNSLLPNQVTARSNRKYYWKCKKGHSYLQGIADRTREDRKALSCPYCANKKVLAGFNDLRTLYPQLMNEWDFNKNQKDPSEYVAHTDKKVWWICENGHSYHMPICNKTKIDPYKCPICSGKQVLVGYNDFASQHPKLLKEWIMEKNDKRPNEITSGSHYKAWWKCKTCGFEWKAVVKERALSGTGCPHCDSAHHSSELEQTVFYYVKSVFDEAINSYHPDWLKPSEIDIFIPLINVGVEYDGENWHRNPEYDSRKTELLSKHGISLIRIREKGCPPIKDGSHCIITDIKCDDPEDLTGAIRELLHYLQDNYGGKTNISVDVSHDKAAILAQYKAKKTDKSFEAQGGEHLKEWDYEKNGDLLPSMISAHSHTKVWWKCSSCGKSFQLAPHQKIKHQLWCHSCRASFVGNRRALEDIKSGKKKSVADFPELLKEWDWDKNGDVDPAVIPAGREVKAHWICLNCGNHFEQSIKNRTGPQKQGCPICARKRGAILRIKREYDV